MPKQKFRYGPFIENKLLEADDNTMFGIDLAKVMKRVNKHFDATVFKKAMRRLKDQSQIAVEDGKAFLVHSKLSEKEKEALLDHPKSTKQKVQTLKEWSDRVEEKRNLLQQDLSDYTQRDGRRIWIQRRIDIYDMMLEFNEAEIEFWGFYDDHIEDYNDRELLRKAASDYSVGRQTTRLEKLRYWKNLMIAQENAKKQLARRKAAPQQNREEASAVDDESDAEEEDLMALVEKELRLAKPQLSNDAKETMRKACADFLKEHEDASKEHLFFRMKELMATINYHWNAAKDGKKYGFFSERAILHKANKS